MSHEIRKPTNCDSNPKGLSYGLLDYVFNLAAGRNIGLKMSKQNILFKANSLILMKLKKIINCIGIFSPTCNDRIFKPPVH
jgi:hypothetical protein